MGTDINKPFNFAEFYGIPRLRHILQVQAEGNLTEFEETEIKLLIDLVDGEISDAQYWNACFLEATTLNINDSQT